MLASTGTRRSRVATLLNGIEITIPARRGLVAAYCASVLVVWAIFLVQMLTATRPTGEPAFPTFFLLPWLLGGAWLVFATLWTAFGRQRLVATRDALDVISELGPLRRRRQFDARQISALRVVDEPHGLDSRRGWSFPVWGSTTGPLAFDYGFNTIRCAAGVSEAEARVIAGELSIQLRVTPAAALG